jgi:hypothetical protein
MGVVGVEPHIGAASDEYRPVCLYSPRPGLAECGLLATRHVLTEDGRYGTVALPTCEDHAPVARLAGSLLAEHSFEGWCGFPSTIWHEALNICLLDDSAEEPSVVERASVAV